MIKEVDFSNRDLFNYKYIPLLHDKKRYIFLMGGGGSGKSVFVSQKEIIKSFEIKDKLMCIRKVKDTLKDSVFAELCRRISEWELGEYFTITKSPMNITNKLTGRECIFKGMDDPEKVKSVEGVARVWVEEATELSREEIDQLDLRLRGKKDMQMTFTFNPTDAEHNLNTDYWVNGDTENQTCLHSTYLDNRFVGEKYKTVMDRLMKTNPNYYNIYALGQRGKLEGVIFNNWAICQEVPSHAQLIGYGIDFGFTNDPTALTALYRFDREVYIDELIYEPGLTNLDIDSMIVSLGLDKRDTFVGDSAEPKSIEELYRRGINIKPCVKGKDSINYGIDLMKQFEFKITAQSTNIIKEFKKYCWEFDKNGNATGKPIEVRNHGIDSIRYLIMDKFDTRIKKKDVVIDNRPYRDYRTGKLIYPNK